MFNHDRHMQKQIHRLLLLILEGNTRIMSQMDDLLNGLAAIGDDVQNLENQLTMLQNNTPPEVNLQPALDAVAQLRQRLEGTAASVQPSDTTGPQPGDTAQQDPAVETDLTVADPSVDPTA